MSTLTGGHLSGCPANSSVHQHWCHSCWLEFCFAVILAGCAPHLSLSVTSHGGPRVGLKTHLHNSVSLYCHFSFAAVQMFRDSQIIQRENCNHFERWAVWRRFNFSSSCMYQHCGCRGFAWVTTPIIYENTAAGTCTLSAGVNGYCTVVTSLFPCGVAMIGP